MESINTSGQSKNLQILLQGTKLVDQIDISRLKGESFFFEEFESVVLFGRTAALQQVIQEFIVGVQCVDELFDIR